MIKKKNGIYRNKKNKMRGHSHTVLTSMSTNRRSSKATALSGDGDRFALAMGEKKGNNDNTGSLSGSVIHYFQDVDGKRMGPEELGKEFDKLDTIERHDFLHGSTFYQKSHISRKDEELLKQLLEESKDADYERKDYDELGRITAENPNNKKQVGIFHILKHKKTGEIHVRSATKRQRSRGGAMGRF